MVVISTDNVTNKILNELSSNHNYPMIKNILIFKDDSEYIIRLILKDSFEFASVNEEASSFTDFHCLELSDFAVGAATEAFSQELSKARLIDLYLYRKKEDITQEELAANCDYMSNKLFSKRYMELTKQESSIVIRYFYLFKYNNSGEIVEDLKKYINREGRFPFKNEWLYKVFEYAKKVSFMSNEDLKEINDFASSYSFNKLCSFIEREKRWPYPSEVEYSRCWSEVCYSYSKGLYSEEQTIRLDILYSRYNNDKDSLGERLVNSYISGLGYRIKKQKTFDDLTYKQKLRFDTCVEIDGNILLIEYDGPQHFKAINYFGGQKGLEETQTRDRLKDEYCQKNNIPLLRISYKQIKDMEALIKEFIERNINKQITVKQ